MSTITIDKKTTISIGSLLVLVPAFFYGVTAWARQQAQVERNTGDITILISKMDTLNSNLIETNQNVVKLTARLDDISNQPKTSATITLHHTSDTPKVVVVSAPQSQSNAARTQPQQTAQPQQPTAPPAQNGKSPQQGNAADALRSVLDGLVSIL